ncbi:hypothetical protein M513_12557 [Trichuris suis]|uniref:Uncharacterized protein n=1 Tax=Trichuris suis TaxID=68888 RepID=A0A085LNN2_9BILA|nr:hypothetical protein M513_12557 [Trichuris suis]
MSPQIFTGYEISSNVGSVLKNFKLDRKINLISPTVIFLAVSFIKTRLVKQAVTVCGPAGDRFRDRPAL